MKKAKLIFPKDGDFLDLNDITESENGTLLVKATLSSDGCGRITINGIPVVADTDGAYAFIPITEGKNLLSISHNGEECEKICVYCFPAFFKKFRISSDDNILFLRNINANKDVYTSIFDDPYLSIYKKAHLLYGACVNLNLFYETDELPGFSEKGEYFNLSMMTDKFKKEWEENSDWLRLSFHSNAEHPNKPYISASYEEIYNDALKINSEIIRFAGERSLSSTTTVHWGEATEEGTVALKDLGYNTLAGYFEISDDQVPRVAYYYPPELIKHIGSRNLWMNHKTKILHARIDLVLNTIKYTELEESLYEIYNDPHRSGFIELMIHEQYFYPGYKRYIPEFERLVLDSAKWVKEKGYSGTFIEALTSLFWEN